MGGNLQEGVQSLGGGLTVSLFDGDVEALVTS